MRPAEQAAKREVCNVRWEKHLQAKKSTVMYHVTKWLLLRTYSYVVTPLQSVEKKEKNIHGLVFHVFVQLVWKA